MTNKENEEGWDIQFDKDFEMKNFALYSKEADVPATTAELKSYIRTLLKTTKEEAYDAGRLAAFREASDYVESQRLNPANAIMTPIEEAENRARNEILNWLSQKD